MFWKHSEKTLFYGDKKMLKWIKIFLQNLWLLPQEFNRFWVLSESFSKMLIVQSVLQFL